MEIKRLRKLWQKTRPAPVPPPAPPPFQCLPPKALSQADVIITPTEVNERHGTGVILRRFFGTQPNLLSIRAQTIFEAPQEFGSARICVTHDGLERWEVFARMLAALNGSTIKRILCVPYIPDDLLSALALKEMFAAPLCVYLMDDNNIVAPGIPDALLRETLTKAELRLAISPEIRDEYQRKFGCSIHLLPPLVPRASLQTNPQPSAPELLRSRTGALLGNVWSQDWLERLKQAVAAAGLQLHWYGNTDAAWLRYSKEELVAAGIVSHGFIPEAELIAKLRTYPYAMIPSGPLDQADDRPGIARLSLPSRMPYLLAVANVPMIVLGHQDTGAARFATRFEVGCTSPYDAPALRAAVEWICQPEQQQRFRQNAAARAHCFCLDDPGLWLWNSLALQKPATDQFDALMPPRDPPAPL